MYYIDDVMHNIILCFSCEKHTFYDAEPYVSHAENVRLCTVKYKL